MKMRKMFLKPVSFIVLFCLLLQTVGAVTATRTNENTHKEFVFEREIDREKAQLIIDYLNGEEVVEPRSILCIFGHSLATSTVYETTHRYWAVSPRCIRVTYRVTYCTRSSCTYSAYTVLSDARLVCCV